MSMAHLERRDGNPQPNGKEIMAVDTIPSLKLNLGCNNRFRSGYINIDKDQYPGVDKVCDVSKIDLPDGCAGEIYASHILEHFSHRKTLDVLREWYRLLEPAGILLISVPDFDRTVELYMVGGLNDWVNQFLWGDQGYDGAYHYCGFNEQRLTNFLEQAGFTDIIRVGGLPGSQPGDCSNLVSNWDKKFVSLNVIAKK